jgi:hypothetical protein
LKGNIVEFKLKSVKPTLPVFVTYLREGTEYATLAYVDYAFDSVEVPDPKVFEGVEDEKVIEDFKLAILASMDYDPGKIPVQAVPQVAWAEIQKVRNNEYKSIFKGQYNDFGPGPQQTSEEEEDGV